MFIVNRWIGGYEHVAVPTQFYKILSRCDDPNTTNFRDCPIDHLLTMTFLFDHVNSGVPSVSHFVTIVTLKYSLTLAYMSCE